MAQNPYGYYTNAQQPIPQNYYPRPAMMSTQQMMLKGRPVSSIEEVKATPIDFDGSIFIFPDVANKRIYTKQVGIDGSAILQLYELKEIPFSDPTIATSTDFVTRKEFDEVISKLKQVLLPLTESVPVTVQEKKTVDLNF